MSSRGPVQEATTNAAVLTLRALISSLSEGLAEVVEFTSEDEMDWVGEPAQARHEPTGVRAVLVRVRKA